MLQAIHIKEGAPQASSLYCRWICVDRPEGKQLVAVWIDSKMRAFQEGREYQANTELHTDSFAEEPDRLWTEAAVLRQTK
jgi:hypothetical protein